MKTKSILTAALISIGATVVNAQVAVEKKSSNVFKITYQDETAGKVKMTILNPDGKEVFSETFKDAKSFARPLDFAGMEQGDYTVEMVDKNGKKLEKISYLLEPSLKNVHLTKFTNEPKYLLAVVNEGTEQITVKIFDKDKHLIVEETKTSANGFARVYHLKDVTGPFTFEVSDKSGHTKTLNY